MRKTHLAHHYKIIVLKYSTRGRPKECKGATEHHPAHSLKYAPNTHIVARNGLQLTVMEQPPVRLTMPVSFATSTALFVL